MREIEITVSESTNKASPTSTVIFEDFLHSSRVGRHIHGVQNSGSERFLLWESKSKIESF